MEIKIKVKYAISELDNRYEGSDDDDVEELVFEATSIEEAEDKISEAKKYLESERKKLSRIMEQEEYV
jgi:hypothetical protein